MILDFRFWIDSIHKRGRVLGILDLLRLLEAELEPKNNPKSKIQNPKSKIQNRLGVCSTSISWNLNWVANLNGFTCF
jgi:hypothetical protein